MWYPDIGKKAHAVPCCFLGKRDVEPYEEASGLDFFVSKTPGSAQRGDNAHRLLGRQLRVRICVCGGGVGVGWGGVGWGGGKCVYICVCVRGGG